MGIAPIDNYLEETMKNNITLGHWLAVPAFALSLGASNLASAQDTTLKAVTDPSFVPFEMMDQDSGEMVGFDMDILHEIADRAGFNVDLAIAGITITDERQEIVDFSDPYYDSGLRILVSDGSDIDSLDDLEGKRVATKIGSTSYDYLQENLGDDAEITPYPGSSDMYMALMGGSADAVFYDAPNVGYFAQTKGKVKTAGPLY